MDQLNKLQTKLYNRLEYIQIKINKITKLNKTLNSLKIKLILTNNFKIRINIKLINNNNFKIKLHINMHMNIIIKNLITKKFNTNIKINKIIHI